MNIKSVLYFIFLFGVNIIYGQESENCQKITNNKALRLLNQATSALNYNDKESLNLLNQAIKLEPEFAQAYYFLGQINYKKALYALNDINQIRFLDLYFSRAEKYFIKVTKICPSHADFQAFYYLGMFYYNIKQYEKAKKYLDIFVTKTTIVGDQKNVALERLKNCNTYFNLINNPVDFNPVSLTGICTSYDEFLPLLSPDGEFMLYTSRYKSKEKDELTESEKEFFSISYRIDSLSNDEDIFTDGKPLTYPFNDGRNQGAVSISIDNNHLFITICDFTNINNIPYKNCDIYTSDYKDNKWTDLRRLSDNINGENTWEGQPSVTANGKILYFASARKGGYGGIDIYRSRKKSSGKWGKAENLGPVINTVGNDKSPFIHSDSQTLYFSSDGRFGMGGYDIFFSKLQKNNTWSEPVNIGYPINTRDDDVGFIVSTNGEKAYFSSNKYSGKGGWDIYSFKLPYEVRPERVLFVKGKLVDENDKALIDAKVELKSTKDNRKTEALVDHLTGKYAVAVSVRQKEEFIMTVKKPDYTFTSQYIKPFDEEIEKPIQIDFEVKPIEVGVKVKLNNIYFDFNSSDLDSVSMIVLDNFIEFLNDNPTIVFRIEGHTDNIDDDEFNLTLSQNRAKSVYSYLLKHGIEKYRMSFKGYGESRPVANNNTDEGRALNRRTEFNILGK
ncbi:MAG: OmpA family protein [Chlorobi bacterium]|nr:OmpA family protein [Chlorobiota bacterium]